MFLQLFITLDKTYVFTVVYTHFHSYIKWISLPHTPPSLSLSLLFRCTIQSRADRLLIRQELGMARKPVFDPAKVSESPAAHVLKVRNVTRCF